MAQFGRHLSILTGDENRIKVRLFKQGVVLTIESAIDGDADLYFKDPVQVIKFCENAMKKVEEELLEQVEGE